LGDHGSPSIFDTRNEMISRHPDDIVGMQQIMQLLAKCGVDAPVADEIAA